MKGMITLRYCEKCNKDFDDDCYFCSYCGSKLDYDDDREPEGIWQGIKKRKGHFFTVAFLVLVYIISLWFLNLFKGKDILYILAHLSVMFGLWNILLSEKTKDDMLFSYNISTVCFIICIICCALRS